ncbi:alkaline phosphatase family protein [Halobacterium salinarum]|uniref:alkaline phosphatase family protein n=1 Tax=Halobacterium salinarum TaxID=2242 RepID=UPI001F1E68CB|nr:alkaline phosphatase family protein [Halobacterium salinarum]MCF2208041.1 alkaline phosphatase family protein [Halobacterium salinarum]MCF2241989.1 alkaline phosphatase family protein [Halobacterium salinarum]
MGLFDRLRGSDAGRVAFVGIDGVPFSLIRDHPDTFPNLHDAMAAGSGGAIESIVPPESSACWPSLTTGVNPGETGVYGFQDRETGSYETYVPMGQDVQATRVWDRVTDAGRDATVMNVPVTFPPQRNVQRMSSGFLSPDIEKAAHPPEFADALEATDYRIDVNAKLGHDDDKAAFIEDAHETIDARQEAFLEYIDADDWDLFFGVFMSTDRVNHFLFKDYEEHGDNEAAFFEFYEKVDRYIGEIRAAIADDVTLVVASDHGFTSEDYEVHLNSWLADQGWLSFDSPDPEGLGDISDDTQVYSFIPGRFYLNREGREPRGSVAADDADAVLAAVSDALTALESPDGRQVVDRVVEGDAVFDGDHDAIAPDLVAIPNHGFDLKAGFSTPGDVFRHGPRNGMHSFENATLVTDAPDVSIPSSTNLYDIAPTLLDLMDVQYDSREFDGDTLVTADD